MIFQIIHGFPAFSVTIPDFHGNPHMLWYVGLFCLCGVLFPLAGMSKLPKEPTKFPAQTLHPLHPPELDVHLHISLCLVQDGITRIYPHCLLPIQELILNLAMISILIPHRHFWKHLLNH